MLYGRPRSDRRGRRRRLVRPRRWPGGFGERRHAASTRPADINTRGRGFGTRRGSAGMRPAERRGCGRGFLCGSAMRRSAFAGLGASTTPSRLRNRLELGWSQRFFGYIDDRAFNGDRTIGGGLCVDSRCRFGGLDTAADHPIGTHRLRGQPGLSRPISLDRRAVRQVGIEQVLQVCPQRCQFLTQCSHLVGCLGAGLGTELAAQMRFQRKLVLTPSRDLPIQLKVVDQLEVAGLGLVDIALAAIGHRHERRTHRDPQQHDDSELDELDPIGENQRRAGNDREHQQRR